MCICTLYKYNAVAYFFIIEIPRIVKASPSNIIQWNKNKRQQTTIISYHYKYISR